eukprot:1879794-Pyramimonas_sp.AAC.1
MLLKGGEWYDGRLAWGSNYLVFGAPAPPVGIPGPDTISSEVLLWGDTDGPWGPKSYTDGSGLASS